MNVSKELLREVLGDKTIGNVLTDVKVIEQKIFGDIKETEIAFYSDKRGWKRINIFELEKVCVDWAISLGFGIMTSQDKEGVSVKLFGPFGLVNEFSTVCKKQYVFNYCNWILNSGFYRRLQNEKLEF